MASQETPAVASSSSGQAVQLEATNAAENLDMLKDIDDCLAFDKTRESRRDDPLAVVEAIHDPAGQYSAIPVPHYNGQNAQLALVPGSAPGIQTGNSTDQVYEEYFQMLEHCKADKDQLNYILYDHDTKVPLKDWNPTDNNEHKDADEDDQVDGKSSDQNISSLGTKAIGKAESATLLQQNVDFSPTATAPCHLRSKGDYVFIWPPQKPEEVEEEGVSVDDVDHTSFNLEPDPDSQKAQNPTDTELVSQTGDVVNMVTVHDEAKEDEENGGIILDQMDMFEGGTNKPLFSTFGAGNDKPAPATGVTTSSTANDVRLAVASLETRPKRAKRAKVNEDDILVNAEHTSSSSSAARPWKPSDLNQNSILRL